MPRHVGIRGMKNVESATKCALDLPHVMAGVLYTDFKMVGTVCLWTSFIPSVGD